MALLFHCFSEKIRLDVSSESSARQRIHLKHQALFSSRDKSKKLKCRLLQFLFGALRVKIHSAVPSTVDKKNNNNKKRIHCTSMFVKFHSFSSEVYHITLNMPYSCIPKSPSRVSLLQ